MAKSFNAQMKDRFARIASSYDAANKLVHETAMMIFDHAKEHGDCSSAQGLVMALPASVRRETLIKWFSLYTPIVVKNSDDWAAKMHKMDSKMFVPWNRDDADANPFYVLAKGIKEIAGPLDAAGLLKMITILAGKLEKKIDNGDVEDTAKDQAVKVLATLKGIKVRVPSNDAAVAPSAGAAAA